MENRKVIVVGAGIGGLAAGYWLQQRGYEVEILEASDRPGGRMVTLERKGDRVDVGAQFYHSSYRYAFDLMDATNLTATKRAIGGKIHYTLGDGSTYLYDRRIPYMKLLGLRGRVAWSPLRPGGKIRLLPHAIRPAARRRADPQARVAATSAPPGSVGQPVQGKEHDHEEDADAIGPIGRGSRHRCRRERGGSGPARDHGGGFRVSRLRLLPQCPVRAGDGSLRIR